MDDGFKIVGYDPRGDCDISKPAHPDTLRFCSKWMTQRLRWSTAFYSDLVMTCRALTIQTDFWERRKDHE